MSIDWSKPIEAVYRDTGAVTDKVAVVGPTIGGRMMTIGPLKQNVTDEGFNGSWQIRNVAPTPPMTDLSPETVGKLVALVRRAAAGYHVSPEAIALVAELPEPVDPDLIEVRRIVADALTVQGAKENILAGDFDDTPSIQAPLACLKRGRALAAGDRL